MAVAQVERRLKLVSELTAAISREIDRLDPSASIAWPELPDVRSMVLHTGNVHRWVTAIVRSRGAVDEDRVASTPTGGLRTWFEEGRTALLETLRTAPPDEPCWILGRGSGTVAFWQRRMVYENVKHLMDLRASGGDSWTPAPELSPADYADGIDELLTVFLARSRSKLSPLPHPIVLDASDTGRRWRIDAGWSVSEPAKTATHDADTAVITAAASDLALALWERADLRDRRRFHVAGSTDAVEALAAAAIHPW